MAYGVIMFYHLHMPLYIVGTFAEYPHKNNYIYFLISIYISFSSSTFNSINKLLLGNKKMDIHRINSK